MRTREYNPSSYDFSMHATGLSIATKNDEIKLHDASIDIGQGEHVSLHGPSGAGKTLLATALCGIRDNSLSYEGYISYGLDHKITGRSEVLAEGDNVLKRHVGFVPQEALVDSKMTARNNILIAARLKQVPINRHILDEVCSSLGLEKFLDQNAGTLSGGQKRRVAIARAFATGPNAVILDEPTVGLDQKLKAETNEMLDDLVRKLGVTIVSVTHEASLASRRIEMADGNIISDTRTPDLRSVPTAS